MSSERETSGRFAKLKGRENYDTWKISAKSYLVIKKVWKCIETGLADDASTQQKEDDLMAWSELSLLVDESVYSHIANTTKAKQAWDALENAFEDSGLCRKVELLKKLIQLRMSDCSSTEDYVNQMVMTSLKVKKAGFNIDDEVLASLLLAGLPDEFTPLVMAIDNSSTKLTSDGVKTLILQEIRLDSNNVQGEAFFTKSKRQGTFKFRCHQCGIVGHMARDCPSKHYDSNTSGHNAADYTDAL